MMMMPEAWENVRDLDPQIKAFYRYHATLMEPWDGPAAICFSDGRLAGMTLDRNGLRPATWLVTTDGFVIRRRNRARWKSNPNASSKKGGLVPVKWSSPICNTTSCGRTTKSNCTMRRTAHTRTG